MSKIEQAMQNKHLAEHRQCLDGIQPMTAAERAAAPNIVMILMDDLGWGDLSCFGSQAIRTPRSMAFDTVALACGKTSAAFAWSSGGAWETSIPSAR